MVGVRNRTLLLSLFSEFRSPPKWYGRETSSTYTKTFFSFRSPPKWHWCETDNFDNMHELWLRSPPKWKGCETHSIEAQLVLDKFFLLYYSYFHNENHSAKIRVTSIN